MFLFSARFWKTIWNLVNPHGDAGELSADLRSFFAYLKEELIQSEFTKSLEAEVKQVRENKEWGREYITWFSELVESKEEAKEEGMEEGELLHLIKTVYKNMLRKRTALAVFLYILFSEDVPIGQFCLLFI